MSCTNVHLQYTHGERDFTQAGLEGQEVDSRVDAGKLHGKKHGIRLQEMAGHGGPAPDLPGVLREARRARLQKNTVPISRKVFIKSFGRSQFPHNSINLSFTITHIKNTLTDLCGR